MDVLSVLSSNLPKSNSAEKPKVNASSAPSAYPPKFRSMLLIGSLFNLLIKCVFKNVELFSFIRISDAGFVMGKSFSTSEALVKKLPPTQFMGPE